MLSLEGGTDGLALSVDDGTGEVLLPEGCCILSLEFGAVGMVLLGACCVVLLGAVCDEASGVVVEGVVVCA